MPHPTAVILVVGLNRSLIGEHSPRIKAFADAGAVHPIQPVLPAVTCSAQATMLTGLAPSKHGIVGNGWYHRELAEIHFWKQSNHLMHGEKIWETARKRDPDFTCANLFWWFNMYSGADFTVTPRPMYKADGRKIPDVYTNPPGLRDELQYEFGQFPLFHFWGPKSSIKSSRWIANASMHVHSKFKPTLTLAYLPHLDYSLQKFGPDHAEATRAMREIDSVVGELIDYFQKHNVRIMLVSEYGIEPVDQSVHLNRLLRDEGSLRVRVEGQAELLDAGMSDAFAVADHQIAHVYIKDRSKIERYANFCRGITGVEEVLDRPAQAAAGLSHERSGDLVLIAESRRWFSYDYWLDDAHAPDFARTVDIHRKPGYDPLELFLDPAIKWPAIKVGSKLLRRRLGSRTLLNVIPLDTTLVRGSHGRTRQVEAHRPVMISQTPLDLPAELACADVRNVMLRHLGYAVES